MFKYKTQSLNRFGEQIIKLEKEIDDYVRGSSPFVKRPIGPVGRFVRLRADAGNDDKLVELLEIELGRGLLNSYICHCRSDRILLERIIKSVYDNRGKPPSIFTRGF